MSEWQTVRLRGRTPVRVRPVWLWGRRVHVDADARALCPGCLEFVTIAELTKPDNAHPIGVRNDRHPRHTSPDGTELSPMRVSECRITLGIVAGREGDIGQAVELGKTGLMHGRQSKVHLLMIAGELDRELRDRFLGEGLVTEFEETLHGV